MTLNWKLGDAVIIAALVGVAVYALFTAFHHADYTKDIQKSEQLDTAHVRRHEESALVTTAVDSLVRRRTASIVRANQLHTSANSIHAIADTLGQNAKTDRDSLNMWHSRDSLHAAEVDSLRREVATLRSALKDDTLALFKLTVDRNKWIGHADSVVRAMDTLRSDLKKAQADQCRILPFIPCLSRKQSLIVGVVGGAVIATYPQQTLGAVRRIVRLGR